jgi:superfamily I DNA/RNA helicase
LTVNYRTSRQILQWCLEVAADQVDDLEGDHETLAGARSMFEGPAPEQIAFDSVANEAEGVASRVEAWNKEGIRYGEIALVARERRQLSSFEDELKRRGIPAIHADAHRDEEALGDRVRLMTMHRAKGLEFRAVALVGVDARSVPAPYVGSLADDEWGLELAKERNLLYVAGSRAREALHVSWVGTPSRLLPGHR